MSRAGLPRGLPWERVAAVVLLGVAVAGAAWLESAAMRVATVAAQRERQLEHLRTLSHPAVRRATDPHSLAALDGLFRDHDATWIATPAGPVLGVTPRAGGGTP